VKYRKLRIAWSVMWGIAAIFFVVLWVRSYNVADIFGCNKQRAFGMTAFSAMGRMMFAPGETQNSLKTLWASLPHNVIHDLKGFSDGSGFKIITDTPPRGPKHVGITLPHWFLVLTAVGGMIVGRGDHSQKFAAMIDKAAI
jgi:hypothetical protein